MEKGGIAYDEEPESRPFLQGGMSFGDVERPKLAKFDPSSDDIVFMNTDIDYYTAKAPGYMDMGDQETTILRIFGVNEQGNSVMAHVYNFRPYFYA